MKRNVILALIYAVISRAMLIIISLSTAYFLSNDDYGTFSYLLLTAASAAALSAAGLGVACNAITAKYKSISPEIIPVTIVISLIIAIILSIINGVFWTIITPENVIERMGLLNFGASLFTISLFMAMANVFEGANYGLIAYPQLVISAIFSTSLSLVFIVVLSSTLGLAGAIGGLLVGRFVSALALAFIIFRKAELRVQITSVRQQAIDILPMLVKAALPIALSGALAGPVIAIAVNKVARDSGIADVGAFNLAYQGFLIVVYPVSALSNFLLSRSASDAQGRHRILHISLMAATCYGAVAAVTLWAYIHFLPPFAVIETRNSLADWFAIACALYCMHLVFVGYWPSIQKGWAILVAQILWAFALLSSLTFKADPASLALAMAVGSLLQVAVGFTLFSLSRRGTQK